MLTIIKNGHLYTPFDIGTSDILIGGGKIIKIAQNIELPKSLEVHMIDASGKQITPGFMDIHVHITGGGGEGGLHSRVPEIQLSQITTAGVTTVLGILGTDDITRQPEALLAKAISLENEGISAYIMVGSYQFPMATITGSIKKDIALIPHVIGVGEIALSDHRSSQPSFQDFAKIVAEARVGGLVGGKSGIVQVHMGSGKKGLNYLFRLLEETEIPIGQVFPTHITRSKMLLEQAVQFAGLGGNIDITASGKEIMGKLSLLGALKRFAAEGVSMDSITISSDANGSLPVFNAKGEMIKMGVGRIHSLTETIQALIHQGDFSVTDILKWITLNPAKRMGLCQTKGAIVEDKDADVVIFDSDWSIHTVLAKGKIMVEDKVPIVKGSFE